MRPYGARKCHCNGKATRARVASTERSEILTQLTEVPDEERVFSDFRELPDDIWESGYCVSDNDPELHWFFEWLDRCNPMSDKFEFETGVTE